MQRRIPDYLRRLVIVPLAWPLLGALNTLVDESHNMIMPDGGSVSAGTIVSVKKGEIFYRQPLGRSHAASAISEVKFNFLGQEVAIGAQEQLIESQVSGTTADQVGASDTLYCTAAKLTGKKRIVGLSEVAAIGLDFDAISKLRHVQTQSCLIDVASDGTADRAFVADTSNRSLIVPVTISPVPIRKLGLARMPGESEARMAFDGPVGIIGNMSTTFSIVEDGKRLAFSNGQTIFRANSLPHAVESFGARFTILSYDPKTKSAQIRIDQPFAAIEYGVKTELRRQY